MKYFAVIPARRGSKGIKNKNMQLISDKPMIKYTFEAAIQSTLLNLAILSSDDPDIMDLAKESGINVPFTRPSHLAQDNSSTVDVINHALDWFKSENDSYPDCIVLLQPTSPFRNSIDLDNAMTEFEKSGRSSLFSACPVSQHPSECFIITKEKKVELIQIKPKADASGRQNYQNAFFIDGAIYITTTDRYLKKQSFVDEDSAVFLMPKSHSIDIDDHYDLCLARAMQDFSIKDKLIFQY